MIPDNNTLQPAWLLHRRPFRNTSLIVDSELENRVNDDPFVAQNIVSAEILEVSPAKVDQRLAFLLD